MQKWIDHKGKKLSYILSGEGPVLVLVHGFGEHSSTWSGQFNAFPGVKLIIPDLPGSGASEMIDDMSMKGIAESVYAILQFESVDNIIILGHSMGGYVTLAFVELYGQLVQGFGLIHSTAFADGAEKKEDRLKGINFIKTNGAAAFLKTAIPKLYAPETLEKNKELVQQHIEANLRFSDEALIRYYQGMMNRPDRTSVLQNTKKRVLFIFGRYDSTIHLEESLKQSYMAQLSYIHILEHSGHMGMQEEADKTNLFLLQYIQDVFNPVGT